MFRQAPDNRGTTHLQRRGCFLPWRLDVALDSRLKRMRWLVVIAVLAFGPPALAGDCVVLLHGLGRTSHSMAQLEKSLLNGGYDVVNDNYPSRSKPVNELIQAVESGIEKCRLFHSTKIHFVTHSLGGILVRAYFQHRTIAEAGRIVMLAPPNHGSEIADVYSRKWWYRYFTGPAGQELGTGKDGISQSFNALALDVGVIAGTKSIDPWFASVMAKPNDGKVSVESAKLTEMRDFITVPYTHTFMARRKTVANQVLFFLSQGRFNHVVDE